MHHKSQNHGSTRLLFLGLITASVLALVIWVFSAETPALTVGDNATVIALSGSLLAMAAIYQFSDSVQVVVSGILRGIYKDTQIILYITLLAYWGVGIPVGYILSRTDWIVPSIGARERLLGCVYHCINYCCCFTLYAYAKNPITI